MAPPNSRAIINALQRRQTALGRLGYGTGYRPGSRAAIGLARARTASGVITVKPHVQSGHFVRQSFRQVSGKRETIANYGSYGPAKALRLHSTGRVEVLGSRSRSYSPTRASAARVRRLFV